MPSELNKSRGRGRGRGRVMGGMGMGLGRGGGGGQNPHHNNNNRDYNHSNHNHNPNQGFHNNINSLGRGRGVGRGRGRGSNINMPAWMTSSSAVPVPPPPPPPPQQQQQQPSSSSSSQPPQQRMKRQDLNKKEPYNSNNKNRDNRNNQRVGDRMGQRQGQMFKQTQRQTQSQEAVKGKTTASTANDLTSKNATKIDNTNTPVTELQLEQQQIEKEKQKLEQLEKEDEEQLQNLDISMFGFDDVTESEKSTINAATGVGSETTEELTTTQRRAKRKARLEQIKKEKEKEKSMSMQIENQEQGTDTNTIGKTNNDDDVTMSVMSSSTQNTKRIIEKEEEKEKERNEPPKRQKLNHENEDKRHNSEQNQKDANLNHQQINVNNGNDDNNDGNDSNDSFDMFASSSPQQIQKKGTNNNNSKQKSLASVAAIAQNHNDNDVQNYNDSEGYYKATTGEIVSFTYSHEEKQQQQQQDIQRINDEKSLQFKVLGIVGKGVFSTVLKCSLISKQSSQQQQQQQQVSDMETDTPTTIETQQETRDVAMKLIRSNEVMTKAAEKEIRILRMLRGNNNSKSSKDPNNHFIIRMLEVEDFELNENNDLDHEQNGSRNNRTINTNNNNVFFHQRPILEYRNHTALLFDYIPNNLRQVLSKFGKNVGINLASVKSYAKQLLLALKHLSSHGIIHADIKLDNILVTSNWTTIKLCDFGSAFLESDEEYINHTPTPYLVSRFYRAPEIILGLPYNKMIDLWSVAVSLAELFTGNVCFSGRTNNDMLKQFMDSVGPFSNKIIRRHISAFTKIGAQPHFESHAGGGGNFDFRRQDFDKVTGKPIIRITSASQDHNAVVSTKQISQVMLRSRSASDNRGDVIKFADFLSRCLTLDPVKRISLDDALRHDMFAVQAVVNK